MKCEACGEEHEELYVHARCHPTAPTWTRLSAHEAVVECSVCRKEVVRLALKPKEE